MAFAPLDPAWPPARLAAVAAALRLTALLVQPGLGADDPCPGPGDSPHLPGFTQNLAPCAPERPAAGPPPSSSARDPRASPRASWAARAPSPTFIAWEQAPLGAGPGLRVSALAPPTFDAPCATRPAPASVGACVPPPDRGALAEPARLAAWLADARVEVVHTVPTVARARWRCPTWPCRTCARSCWRARCYAPPTLAASSPASATG
ncbi:MAG: hypothetical protein R3F60_00780 [bacterium]